MENYQIENCNKFSSKIYNLKTEKRSFSYRIWNGYASLSSIDS